MYISSLNCCVSLLYSWITFIADIPSGVKKIMEDHHKKTSAGDYNVKMETEDDCELEIRTPTLKGIQFHSNNYDNWYLLHVYNDSIAYQHLNMLHFRNES